MLRSALTPEALKTFFRMKAGRIFRRKSWEKLSPPRGMFWNRVHTGMETPDEELEKYSKPVGENTGKRPKRNSGRISRKNLH